MLSLRPKSVRPFLVCAALAATVLSGCPGAPMTERVSVSSTEEEADRASLAFTPAISADGRYVAFASDARNLVAGDGNGKRDVFVRDRQAGTTTRASVGLGGVDADCSPPDGCFGSDGPEISDNGRWVAFTSDATNLVAGPDENGGIDVFVYDRGAGATVQASVATDGTRANGLAGFASLSADGRFVVFTSYADNLVAGDGNGDPESFEGADIFVRDLQLGTTERVSVATDGTEGDAGSDTEPDVSADGRIVAFASNATNLVPDDGNGVQDVFAHDRQTGATERVSVASDGTEAAGASDLPSASEDGRTVAFESSAANLVPDDGNGKRDVFVRDRATGVTERVSVSSGGAQGDGDSFGPSISRDGRFVAFTSYARNFAPLTTGISAVFAHDRQTGETARIDIGWDGQGSNFSSFSPSADGGGRFTAFLSNGVSLILLDQNAATDVFVRDRGEGF